MVSQITQKSGTAEMVKLIIAALYLDVLSHIGLPKLEKARLLSHSEMHGFRGDILAALIKTRF